MKNSEKTHSPRNHEIVKGKEYNRKFDYKRDDTLTLLRKYKSNKVIYDKAVIFDILVQRMNKQKMKNQKKLL